MNAMKKTVETEDVKAKQMSILSTVWIFATVNYLYCDLIALIDPTGYMKTVQATQAFLLEAAILVEIPMAMIILSRVLKYRANRWANIAAGTIMTVVQTATLFVGTPTLYYVFFSVIEIVSTAAVVWYAWKWPSTSRVEESEMQTVVATTTN